MITTSADGAESVHATDIDGDSDTDVLSASSGDTKIAWYENDGATDPSFTTRTITTNASFPLNVYAANVDGDDDVDVLSASGSNIVWYENDGASDPSFTARTITTNADGAESVYAADVDGDTDTDILSASDASSSFSTDKIAWYENDGTTDPSFTTHTITTSINTPVSVYASDVDGDSDTDVLSASQADDKIAWYENDGASDPSFTTRTITTNLDRAESVYAATVDGDSHIDVLASALGGDDPIVWYENDGANDPSFTANTITTNVDGPFRVYAANADGDSDTDVFSVSSVEDKVLWYENDGATEPSFSPHTITTNANGATSVYATDVDGDTDTDVLSASFDDDKIAWYENSSGNLPVELARLTAQMNGQSVHLSWTTASETGNVGFYVQHQGPSQEGWGRLGFVEGAGTTSEPTSYRFDVESDLGPGTHRFRLRQVDTDGTAHLSKTVSVELQMRKRIRLAAPAPNPATEQARLTFAVKEPQKTTVTVYNVLGQQVRVLYRGRPAAGQQKSLNVDASRLGSGTYLIRLQVGDAVKTRKLTVVR